jgi:hypothetical protein
VADPSLEDLEAQRDRLYEQLAATGDFRRGSISENYPRCGKPNCVSAQPRITPAMGHATCGRARWPGAAPRSAAVCR